MPIPTVYIPMPTYTYTQCHDMPTHVVSVHAVSYAYNILCPSYVTYSYI